MKVEVNSFGERPPVPAGSPRSCRPLWAVQRPGHLTIQPDNGLESPTPPPPPPAAGRGMSQHRSARRRWSSHRSTVKIIYGSVCFSSRWWWGDFFFGDIHVNFEIKICFVFSLSCRRDASRWDSIREAFDSFWGNVGEEKKKFVWFQSHCWVLRVIVTAVGKTMIWEFTEEVEIFWE